MALAASNLLLLIVVAQVTSISLDEAVARITPNMTKLRREFHMYPEIGFDLNRTHDRLWDILSTLDAANFHLRTAAETGLLLDIDGYAKNKSASTPFKIALRSDMDALPMHEENPDLPWESTIPGHAHMCGHDGHMVCLVGAALLFSQASFQVPQNLGVRFMFQPSEESGTGGALPLIKDGCLIDINEVYGMHYGSPSPFGLMATKPGPISSHYSYFNITVHGKGGHSSAPQEAVDPIVVGAEIVVALQTVVSRYMPPGHPAVISICKFHAGEVANVIPDTAILEGSTRDFSGNDFQIIQTRMQNITENICAGFGATCTIQWENGYPESINTPKETDNVYRVAKTLGLNAVIIPDASMASEDFSYYLQKVPGCFFFLGGGMDGKHNTPNHSPTFDFNDDIIPDCIKMWVRLIEDRLGVKLYS